MNKTVLAISAIAVLALAGGSAYYYTLMSDDSVPEQVQPEVLPNRTTPSIPKKEVSSEATVSTPVVAPVAVSSEATAPATPPATTTSPETLPTEVKTVSPTDVKAGTMPSPEASLEESLTELDPTSPDVSKPFFDKVSVPALPIK